MSTATPARFNVGDAVRVRAQAAPPHCRTPSYVRGKVGYIGGRMGAFWNPETSAEGGDGQPDRMVYHVHFAQQKLWPGYAGEAGDELIIDIYEHWLDAATAEELQAGNL
jgi:nitrile hydratase